MLRVNNLIGFGAKRVSAPATWLVNAAATMNSGDSGYNGVTLRQVIQAAGIANTGGSKVRVTLQASPVFSFTIDGIYIGHAAASGDPYDFESTPTQLFFGGSAGIGPVAVNAAAVTDEAVFTVQASKALIVSMHFSATSYASVQFPNTTTDWQVYIRTANDAAVVNTSGYSTQTGIKASMVSKIESLV
jgi:hypothetical protein